MILFDAHTHLQMSQFNNDRDEVIKRALDAGVWMINAGADRESSIKGIEIANKYNEGVYATVGQHPTEDGQRPTTNNQQQGWDYEFFKKIAQNEKVVAIGECGLEYYRDMGQETSDKERQKHLFIEHIKLSKELNKPLVIHCRNAFPDLINILMSHVSDLHVSNVIHFFTGTLEDAKKLLDMGFYFTFGGAITFPQAQKIRMGEFGLPEPKAEARFSGAFDEIIKFIPLDKIMVETDAPYVSPTPYRGKRNEPAYVIEVAKKLAEIKEVSFEEVCKQTMENNKKVFGINVG